MYYIGIDIGTSSVKVLAIDEAGKIVKTVSREYPISYPFPLWSEQNPNDWWEQSKLALKDILEYIDKDKVKSIGFSGQMHGLVILDSEDKVIRPAILWNDQRTESECRFLNNDIGKDKLLSWTANIALNGFTAPKVLWVKQNEPENFKKIAKICLPKDYIAYKLSGEFATDYSDASGTLYLDVKNKKWSDDMMNILDIDENKLPKLYDSFSAIGTIKKDIATELGLPADVKIVIGGGDQAVAAVGGGIVENHHCSISLGTSGAVFATSDEFVMEDEGKLHVFCDARGKYHVMGVTLSAAASLKWYVEDFLKASSYDEVLTEVEKSDINENVYYLPYLSGERTPHNDPDAKATFLGMTVRHERKDMTRALLEGVCYSLRDCYELMHEVGINPKEIIINGGGAKNDFWCQMLADVLHTKIKKLDINEGPALGAAILALVGDGKYSSVSNACQDIIKTTKEFTPDEVSSKIYSEKYKKYKSLYPMLKDFFSSL